MPTYEYNGQKFSVDKEPTEAEFAVIAQTIDATKQQQPTQEKAPEEQTLGRAAGITARGLLNLAASPAMLLSGIANKTANALTGTNQFRDFGQDFNERLTGLGLPEPQNWQEAAAVGAGKYAPAIAAPATLLGQAGAGAVVGSALAAPGDELKDAALNAALPLGLKVAGKALNAVPRATSGGDVAQAYRAGRLGDENYSQVMRGLSSADEAIEYGAKPMAMRAAEKARSWTPDITRGIGHIGVNALLDPSGLFTAGQILSASPRFAAEVAYGLGKSLSMADRVASSAAQAVQFGGGRYGTKTMRDTQSVKSMLKVAEDDPLFVLHGLQGK